MTEAEWLAATDPAPLFARLVPGMSERKARLLRVAVARAIWDEFTHPELREAVEVAERHADGECGEEAVAGHSGRVYRMLDYPPGEPPAPLVHLRLAINALAGTPLLLGRYVRNRPPEPSFPGGGNWHAAMRYAPGAALAAIRDLFGDRQFDPRWLTETVTLLARGIYRDRAFDRLPVLADALEEAGCDCSATLAHCRGDGFHARGCWVVDRVLGKT